MSRQLSFAAQFVGGFKVISLEVLEVILRDEKDLLQPLDEVTLDATNSLFSDGFSAGRFVEIVESGEL